MRLAEALAFVLNPGPRASGSRRTRDRSPTDRAGESGRSGPECPRLLEPGDARYPPATALCATDQSGWRPSMRPTCPERGAAAPLLRGPRSGKEFPPLRLRSVRQCRRAKLALRERCVAPRLHHNVRAQTASMVIASRMCAETVSAAARPGVGSLRLPIHERHPAGATASRMATSEGACWRGTS